MSTDKFPVELNGKTYDIKEFLHDHPGGVNTLKKFKGKSVARAMSAFGHSPGAYHILNQFRVSDANLTGEVSGNGRIITKEESDLNAEEIAAMDELEAKADWSKPLYQQLEAIAPFYQSWVNISVHRRARIFESDLLELLTVTPWYFVLLFWIPIIMYMAINLFKEYVLCGDVCTKDNLTVLQFAWHLASGVLIWSVLEYTLHRWLFHLNPGSSLTLIKLHFLLHGLHHKTPFDELRQVFPPHLAAVFAVLIYWPISIFFTYPLIKFVGGLAGYVGYEMIHYYDHQGSPRDGSYLYAMKRYHSNHHFVNHDKAFGVSSQLWDHLFKTYVRVKKLGYSLHW